MILYLAEKPSLAKLICEHLGEYAKKNGYFLLSNGNVVSWCFGHMYENYSAGDYDEKFNVKWKMEDLPIIPKKFELKPKESAVKQLKVINELIVNAETIINCGDPDREGQLLIDEVIEEANFNKEVKRAWLNDLSDKGLTKTLNNLKDNANYKPLSDSAKARSHLDWLTGINLTRVYTLHANSRGHNILLSVGRVQTPTTFLVVERDNTILNFKSIEFYEINGEFEINGINFNCKKRFEKEINDKCVDKEYIEKEIKRMNDISEFKVHELTKKDKETKAPLPFSLSDLQSYCNEKHSLSAQEVLDVSQSLYAIHKITTYPRSDCKYLNENSFDEMIKIIPLIDNTYINILNLEKTPRCFNDAKVTAHTAIVPNGNLPDNDKLSKNESIVYKEICLRFIAQFANNYKYNETILELINGNDIYYTTGKAEADKGFKAILSDEKKSTDKILPNLKDNEIVSHLNSSIVIKNTSPPKPYNEGTLIKAMNNIGKNIDGEDNKNILKEIGGIGTEATRASIIENLKERDYLEVNKKNILSTKRAKNFIDIVLDDVKSPLLTAKWEHDLKLIEIGMLSYNDFMDSQNKWIVDIVEKAKNANIDALGGLKCKSCETGYLKTIKTNKSSFIGCTNYPDCKYVRFPKKQKKLKRDKFLNGKN